MPRTDVSNVRMELEADGYELEAITNIQIETVGISPAELEVDENLADTGMSERRLEHIECYLAGHFILSSGINELRQIDSETLSDGSSASYSGDRDHTDYRSTSLGQKAILMDESGTLRDADKLDGSIRASNVRGA
ncbi:hypothetical protein [Natrinema soli]|uniref:Uncharacterized protein n=1 Tax=Natrinema soli TaxID=1930624 RepID=A0ABD5SNA3_9EURY|nr:hypothetical protein [Natrinema soli]